MAECHIRISTGYETLASAKIDRDAGKAAECFNIASDEEMGDSRSATDKTFAPNSAASTTNERADGAKERPLHGSSTGASRLRSRSSRATSRSGSSAEEVPVAMETTARTSGSDRQRLPTASDI